MQEVGLSCQAPFFGSVRSVAAMRRHGKLKAAVIAFLFIPVIGCRNPVTWSAESASPDGMWMATAQTVERGGFGTAAVETTVTPKRSRGSGSAQRVLAFAEGGREIRLRMRWEGPSHLLVTYHGSPELLYFQVVKTSGADISVQNVSASPQQEFHPSARP